MNKRQAKKIVQSLILFQQGVHNYQPYSISQQLIAFMHLGCRLDEIYRFISYKVPIRYRHYDPHEIAKVMLLYHMQPTCAKEYKYCMECLENAIQKSCPDERGNYPHSDTRSTYRPLRLGKA